MKNLKAVTDFLLLFLLLLELGLEGLRTVTGVLLLGFYGFQHFLEVLKLEA